MGAHLDPLVRADGAHSDGDLRSVQQNLELGTFGIFAGTNADGDHPAGTLLTWQTRGADETMPQLPLRRFMLGQHSPLCGPLAQNFF